MLEKPRWLVLNKADLMFEDEAQAAAEAARPYAERLEGVVASLASKVGASDSAPKLLSGTGKSDTHLLVVLNSDRGLAGAFNSNIVKAARDIIAGASLDYNLPCIAEKSVIVVECVADQLIQQMREYGALQITDPQQMAALREVCIQKGAANKQLVGKSPAVILEAAGLPVPAKVPKLIILETAADDPLVVTEQLMPVLPIVRVDNFEQGLALALKVEDGLHHTAIMHSQNVSRLNKAAHLMQTSIFVKNGPSFAGIGVGAEGFTTFTIATPTGEGTTSARTFGRLRRCVLTNGFSIR